MRTYTVRFEEGVYEELGYLSNMLGMSMNKVMNLLVRGEYNKYQTDPVYADVVNKLQKMREIFVDGAEGQTRLY